MKYLGLLATLWMIAGTCYLLWRVETDPKSTISQHAALSKKARLFFALYFIPGALAINYFLAVWFVPHFGMSPWWVYLLVVASVCDIVLGLVPDAFGWQKAVHQITAYSAAVLSMFFTIAIFLTPTIGISGRVVAAIGSVYMITVCCLFIFQYKQHRLVLQSLYILSFYIAVLMATFL